MASGERFYNKSLVISAPSSHQNSPLLHHKPRPFTKSVTPHADLHPMRVLFLIPKSNPPELLGNYSKSFKEFIALCLNKDPKT